MPTVFPTTDDIRRFILLKRIVEAPSVENQNPEVTIDPTDYADLTKIYSRTTPAPPNQDGGIRLIGYEDTGRLGLGVITPALGYPLRVQTQLGLTAPRYATATDGLTTISGFGFSNQIAGTIAPTLTAQTIDANAGTLLARQRRFTIGTTGANQAVTWWHDKASFYRGAVGGQGGFNIVIQFGISAATAGNLNSYLVGLTDWAGTHLNFNTTNGWVNTFAFICSATGTNNNPAFWSLVMRGATTNSNLVVTTMPRPVVGDVYIAKFYSAPGSPYMVASLLNATTGDYYEKDTTGQLDTDIPGRTVGLTPHLVMANAAATGALGLDFMSVYADVV